MSWRFGSTRSPIWCRSVLQWHDEVNGRICQQSVGLPIALNRPDRIGGVWFGYGEPSSCVQWQFPATLHFAIQQLSVRHLFLIALSPTP